MALTQRKLEEYYDDVRAYERLLKKKERLFKRLEKQMHENIAICKQVVDWYNSGGDDGPNKRPSIPKPKPTGPAVDKLKELIKSE